MNASEFKSQFSLVEYVKQHFDYIERGQDVFIACPFHSEETPSCLISDAQWHCFGACGSGGDSIDFIMKVTGCSFLEVMNNKDILSKYPINTADKKERARKVGHVSPSLMKNYSTQLLRKPSKIKYLESRGFNLSSIKASHMGYGIPVDVFGWKFRHPRYVIPHFENGKVVGVKYRIDPRYEKYESEKYITHPGTSGSIYNIDVLKQHDNIIYVGSQFDAAVLWYRYNIPSICPPSENTFKTEWIPLFVDKSVLIWLDNDETGINSSLKVYKSIRSVAKKADVFMWDKGIYKPKDDFTDFLIREGIDAVKQVYASL